MKKFLFIVAAGVIALSSCKKDDKKCDVNTTSIAGSYKVTSVKYKANASTPEVDGIDLLFFEACEKDDILTLNANGTYTITDAGVVCDPAGGDSGNWSTSGSTITVDGSPATVASFDCTNLVITLDDSFAADDKMTITYNKQ